MIFHKMVAVTKFADVREVLDRLSDFNLSDLLGSKMPWGPLLLSLDWPEQHDRERKLLQSVVFRSDDVQTVRTLVTNESRALIQKTLARGEIDMVTELSDEIVVHVLKCYFGIPVIGGTEEMTRILGDVAGFMMVEPPPHSKRANRAYASMARLTQEVLDRVRSQGEAIARAPGQPTPADDLLTRLVKLRCAGNGPSWLNDDWIRRYITGLAATGGGTIVRATTQAMDRLLAHPAALRKARNLAAELAAEYDECAWQRLQQIVYEALRFRPMLPLLGRYSPRETIIAKGTPRARMVPAGATVIAPPIAAMFDPEVFENPSRFSSSRPLKDYIHFGYGPRVCFGRYVADIVIVETIRSLLLLPGLKRAPGCKGRIHYDGPVVSSLRLRFDRGEPGPAVKMGK